MFFKDIEGNGIKIRKYIPEDVSAWQRWDVDPEVQKFMPPPMNVPVSDQAQLEYLKECESDPKGIYGSILVDDKVVGTVSITDIHDGVGELGIVIGEKDYRRKGIAGRAVALAIGAAHKGVSLTRIFAEYEEGNIAVQKMLERLGFQKEAFLEGSRTKDGQKVNTLRYILNIF